MTAALAQGQPPSPSWGARCLRAASLVLGGVAWFSAGLFGLYILAFYVRAWAGGEMQRWNEVLPGLYSAAQPAATAGIGLHFLAGGLILVLGAVQLIGPLRQRLPWLHRWVGRVYAGACAVAALGGLVFIATVGTIGGTVMNVGFGLYGLLMLLASVHAVRHARAGRFEAHRAWALRLFALAIGSWLYRMEYGFWMLFTDGLGHDKQFRGPFDQVMAFFFYLPNLLLVELMLRRQALARHPAASWLGAAALALASGFLTVGTYYFVRYYWGPAILKALYA